MDSQPPPNDQNPDRQPTPPKPDPAAAATSGGDATMTDSTTAKAAAPEPPKEPEEAPLPDEILNASAEDIMARTRLIDNDLKVMRSETMRLNHERSKMRESIKDNTDKIKNNKMLPYLVGNVVEVSLALTASSRLVGPRSSAPKLLTHTPFFRSTCARFSTLTRTRTRREKAPTSTSTRSARASAPSSRPRLGRPSSSRSSGSSTRRLSDRKT